jgi:hypothetical protein
MVYSSVAVNEAGATVMVAAVTVGSPPELGAAALTAVASDFTNDVLLLIVVATDAARAGSVTVTTCQHERRRICLRSMPCMKVLSHGTQGLQTGGTRT